MEYEGTKYAWWLMPIVPAQGRQRQVKSQMRATWDQSRATWEPISKNQILGVVAHIFNPSIQEAEAGRFLGSRPPWSTKWVLGQPGLFRETLSRKNTKKKKEKLFPSHSESNSDQVAFDFFVCFFFVILGWWMNEIDVRGFDCFSVLNVKMVWKLSTLTWEW